MVLHQNHNSTLLSKRTKRDSKKLESSKNKLWVWVGTIYNQHLGVVNIQA